MPHKFQRRILWLPMPNTECRIHTGGTISRGPGNSKHDVCLMERKSWRQIDVSSSWRDTQTEISVFFALSLFCVNYERRREFRGENCWRNSRDGRTDRDFAVSVSSSHACYLQFGDCETRCWKIHHLSRGIHRAPREGSPYRRSLFLYYWKHGKFHENLHGNKN